MTADTWQTHGGGDSIGSDLDEEGGVPSWGGGGVFKLMQQKGARPTLNTKNPFDFQCCSYTSLQG